MHSQGDHMFPPVKRKKTSSLFTLQPTSAELFRAFFSCVVSKLYKHGTGIVGALDNRSDNNFLLNALFRQETLLYCLFSSKCIIKMGTDQCYTAGDNTVMD